MSSTYKYFPTGHLPPSKTGDDHVNPKLNKYLYHKLEKYARTKLNRPLLYEFSRWKMIGILKISL